MPESFQIFPARVYRKHVNQAKCHIIITCKKHLQFACQKRVFLTPSSSCFSAATTILGDARYMLKEPFLSLL